MFSCQKVSCPAILNLLRVNTRLCMCRVIMTITNYTLKPQPFSSPSTGFEGDRNDSGKMKFTGWTVSDSCYLRVIELGEKVSLKGYEAKA